MGNKIDIIMYAKFAIVAVGGFLTSLLGGWDILLEVLITFVVIDYVTGIIKALMGKSDKSTQGGLTSGVMFRGGLRKILVFAVVAVACVIDKIILPGGTLIRSGAILYYVCTEGLSILENIAMCGVPIPDKLPDKLKEILEGLKHTKEGE